MEEDFKTPVFGRSVLTAVFVGIFATLFAIVYDVYFKENLHFPLSSYINVSTIIFGVNLLFFFIGFVYYGFVRSSRKGEIIYMMIFLVLTVIGVWRAENAHRSDDHLINMEFRNLLAGIVIIIGLLAAVAIPVLYHNKKFEKYVV